jgi:hypothetical protein
MATVAIDVGSAVAGADGKAPINVTLSTGGATVGGMQNDIIFDNTQVSLVAGDCRINAAISNTQASCEEDPVVGPCKNLSKTLKQCGASPQPPGCPADAGTNLSVFRGIVAATAVPNTNEIPDGVLYTCTFTAIGTLPATLTNSNIVASEPDGTRLTDVTGSNGVISGAGGATPTNTQAAEPTPTPTGVQINVARVTPGADNKAPVDVTLISGGFSVGGMQNDIIFDNTQVSLVAGDCKINAAISNIQASCEEDPVVGPCKNLSKTLKQCGASPQPPGCPADAGTNLSVFRGIVAATAVPNTNEIPDGVLYTCTFTAIGTLPATLTNSNIVASEPDGTRLTEVSGADGDVHSVGPPNTPTNTVEVSPTDTPAPTNTPTIAVATATRTATVRATNTATPTPPSGTVTPTEEEDDGCDCRIATPGSSRRSWLLIVPVIGLLALRRRHRR